METSLSKTVACEYQRCHIHGYNKGDGSGCVNRHGDLSVVFRYIFGIPSPNSDLEADTDHVRRYFK